MINPNNIDAEQSLLCAIMLKNDIIQLVQDEFNSNMFYYDKHKMIYDSMLELKENNSPIDLITTSNQLKKHDELDIIGGAYYLTKLLNHSATHFNYYEHVKIIKECYLSSQLIKMAYNAINQCSENSDPLEVSAYLSKSLSELPFYENEMSLIGDVCSEFTKELAEPYKAKDTMYSQFQDLNKIIDGFEKQQLIIIGARPAMGKGLLMKEKILTNTGWVENGDLKIGDFVISMNGDETRVAGIYPQGKRDCYKVTFSDGREIITDDQHNWQVFSTRRSNSNFVATTAEIHEMLKKERYKKRISIPLFSGNYGVEKDFTIHPYIMGVLIGDGCLTNGVCYSSDKDIIYEKSCKFSPKHVSVNKLKYRSVSFTNWLEARIYLKENKLNTTAENKYIPKEYFNSSKKQREMLFQGLMDTDGYVRGDDSYEYSTTSEVLADDIMELSWSLGYKAKKVDRESYYTYKGKKLKGKINYRIYITKSRNMMTIDSVVPCGKFETQCISVEHESKLFVTKDFLVTHNTALALNLAYEFALKANNGIFFSMEMSKKKVLQRIMTSVTKISGYDFKHKRIDDWKMINKLESRLKSMNLHIFDSSQTLQSITAKCLKVKNKTGLDFIFVDYWQMMKNNNKGSRFEKVSEDIRGLKQLATDLDITVFALAQISRESANRADKTPMLTDLKESGEAEQSADTVIMLHRPEYYDENYKPKGLAEVLVVKQREGQTGKIFLNWEPHLLKFTSRMEI